MVIEVVPLPLPPSADPSKFRDFGREVRGVHPGKLTDDEFKEIEQLLYKVCAAASVSLMLSRSVVRRAARCTPLQKHLSPTRGAVQAHESTSDANRTRTEMGLTGRCILHPGF